MISFTSIRTVIRVKIEQAFLCKIDGSSELTKITEKLKSTEKLTDEDLMRLAILPLPQKGREAKVKMIDEVIDTAEMMQQIDEAGTSFVLSAMFVAAGNFITLKQEDRIKEVLDMTSLGRIYEQERIQYGELCSAIGRATVYVKLVDKKMQEKGMTEKEACNKIGITLDTYITSKALIDSNKQVAARLNDMKN